MEKKTMTEEWTDEVECLRGWTKKTSIGNQEAYNELWIEINRKVKAFDAGEAPCPKCKKTKYVCIWCERYIEG